MRPRVALAGLDPQGLFPHPTCGFLHPEVEPVDGLLLQKRCRIPFDFRRLRLMLYFMVKIGAVASILLVLFGSDARAVLVYDGTAANLSAPTDDPGWDAVGSIYINTASNSPATAIFLGNNGDSAWFLTANHVNLANATLSIGGSTYTTFAGIDQIGTVDLQVFRIDTTIAGITPVTLASTVPNAGAAVTMIGYGKTGTKVTWDTSGGTWTSPGAGAEGYTWSGDNVKRWGTNSVLTRNISTGSGNLLVTDFDNTAGEAQASLGDSGGAVFRKSGPNWTLTALMVAVGHIEGSTLSFSGFTGQPSSTSVDSITGAPSDKSVTYSVQIADYRTEILSAIPEPATAALVLCGLLLPGLFALKSRRRTR